MTTLRNILFPVWIAIAGMMTGCSDTLSPEVEMIHIEGVSWACNVTTSYATFGSTIETGGEWEVLLPASEGDLLYMIRDDLQLYYRYRPENGTRLTVTFDTLHTVSVYLNGKLEFIELGSPSSLQAFSQLTEPEVKQLSTIYIHGPLSDDLLLTLKQHETSLTGKGLVMEGGAGSENLCDLLSICPPRLLIIDDSWSLPEPAASNVLSSLELLWVEGNVPALSKMAQCCGNLESLIIADWEPVTGELLPLSGLKKLQNLTIAESELTSLSGIEFPKSLRNLHLVSCDTLSDISELSAFQELNRLSLTLCNEVKDVDLLQEMGSLQWLSFPANISHKEFREVTSRLTQLEVVELISCTEIKDLAPLQSLQNLNTLMLFLEKEQLTMLDSLEQVKYIVLTNEVFEDNPEWIKELRAALPNSEIVPGSGICLGSGWLLLLLPFIFLFRLLFRHKA